MINLSNKISSAPTALGDILQLVTVYQSTKGVQWVNVENISEEDPMVMGEKVSKPVVGNLGSSDVVASVNYIMLLMFPCHMYLVM